MNSTPEPAPDTATDYEEGVAKLERGLAAIRTSTTWKAGRAVVAVPARIRRLGRG